MEMFLEKLLAKNIPLWKTDFFFGKIFGKIYFVQSVHDS